MADDIREHIRNRAAWLRLFYIVLFAVILYVASAVLAVAVIIQFGFVLLTGRSNGNLARFGRTLARFIADVVLYMTFNTDDRPFPFSEWPTAEASRGGRASRSRRGGSRAGGTRSQARSGTSGGGRSGGGKSTTGGADNGGETDR
ncbi:MAG TPA: DUF4389 domain-containing protein [Gammaproteobacteria bacterium]|nr:DUF4389 domain-containing protein [Gammaproteobacteria bacterium]